MVKYYFCGKVALPIMSKFTARTNGSFIKIAHSSVGWSYYECDPEFGSLQAKYLVMELERELAAYDVRFVNLKGIVEVVPRRLNKGIVVKKILRYVAAQNDNAGVDFVLCMGDDISDEKMFTVSNGYIINICFQICFSCTNLICSIFSSPVCPFIRF